MGYLVTRRAPLIAPSLLGCDMGSLGDRALELQEAGADMIHLDIMDGCFVPVLTFGPGTAAAIGRRISIPMDAHLMVSRPEPLLEPFARAGCRYVTIHPEVTDHLDRLLRRIRSLGCGAGVALNPATPPELLRWVAPVVDLVLVMAVNPGYGGQEHLEEVHAKIPEVRRILDAGGGGAALISVDGGVNGENAPKLVSLGTDILVSGSYITGSADPTEAVRRLRDG